MSTGTAECVTLEDINLDEVPPCAIWHGYWDRGEFVKQGRCGKPSAVRIRFSCKCGRESIIFVCQTDYDLMKLGKRIGCNGCGGAKFRWTEI